MNNEKEPDILGIEKGIHRHVLTWHSGKNVIPVEISLFNKVFEIWFERHSGLTCVPLIIHMFRDIWLKLLTGVRLSSKNTIEFTIDGVTETNAPN